MSHVSKVESLKLPAVIQDAVTGWSNQGYHPFPTERTRELLNYWFKREHDEGEQFHPCQQRAIEAIIYLHEICKIKAVREVYEQFAPERLNLFPTIAKEIEGIPFAKYCIKAATGSGKTWVLTALVLWQYFNALEDAAAAFSSRFMIVTPGLEVRNRILDAFKGRRDPLTGSRDPATADFRRSLFMPDDSQWKERFHMEILEPQDIRANTEPPDGPFLAITNWQQFALAKDKQPSLAEEMGLADDMDEPQGEIIADFMTTYPDLVVLNDEAHHVHGRKTAKAEELVWRRFMRVLHERMVEKHGQTAGLFLQLDFSATPFYGSGKQREYFPHIVYDYDLRDALNDRLVKQLFLEERAAPKGSKPLDDLDFRALRDDEGAVSKLSSGQKQIVTIGLSKLNQLTNDFVNKGLNRKPVLMVLCEDTTVADRVRDYLLENKGPNGELLTDRNVLLFHSNLEKAHHGYTMEEARGNVHDPTSKNPTLAGIDDDDDPLRIVVSVLALREGFDKTNICVTAVLRATEADMLLEQIVGRGLRLMFPKYRYPELDEAKRQAFDDLKEGQSPQNALDFLYIVEHPRFRTFYNDLRKQGYLIGQGDTSKTSSTGDVVPVEATAERIKKYDIAWPNAVQAEAKAPDLSQIDIATLPSGMWEFSQIKTVMEKTAITDTHLETGTHAATWDLKNRFFDYAEFLRDCANAIAGSGQKRSLSGSLSEIAGVIDDYVTHRLFKKTIEFDDPANYVVLGYGPVRDHVISTIRAAVADLVGALGYEVLKGTWRRLSDLPRVFVSDATGLPTLHCIYARLPVSKHFGGFERQVMHTTLDRSPELLAWCKLQRRHNLAIPYRDPAGLMRKYEVDFVCRSADRCFLLETKSDKDMTLESVAIKARAAVHWCKSISGLPLPAGVQQPLEWEYLLLDESTYKANAGGSFSALLPFMRQTRDRVVAAQSARETGKLFV